MKQRPGGCTLGKRRNPVLPRSHLRRKAFAFLAIVLAASIVAQFYLAAVGVFSNPDDGLFSMHGMLGRHGITLLALLLISAAAVARAGKKLVWTSVLPLVLVLFQTVLFILTGTIFNVGPPSEGVERIIPLGARLMLGLHALNGAAIFFICTVLVRRSRKLAFVGRLEPSKAADGTGLDVIGKPTPRPDKNVRLSP